MDGGTGVLIVGAGGQLGKELKRSAWPKGFEVTALTSTELDITDAELVIASVKRVRPTVIINAAAYTAVDAAEDNEARATAVNALAVGHLATAANLAEAALIHISTDYVFDGEKEGWYTEADEPNPLGVYGRTKLLGEQAALEAERSVTLRTSWVYSALGSNFVTKILQLAATTDDLGVVGDQFGCPTATSDLADAIVQLAEILVREAESSFQPLYHLASSESANWFEFAEAILEAADIDFTGASREVTTADYPTKAKRPANSRLDSSLIDSHLGIRLPSWRHSLQSVVREIEA